MCLMQGWKVIGTKSEWGFLLVFYWSLSDIKYLCILSSAKEKHPTPDQIYFFSFLAWKETELMDVLKCFGKSILFNILFSNNFTKCINFRYWGNVCTQLYISTSYLLAIYIYSQLLNIIYQPIFQPLPSLFNRQISISIF